MGNTVTVDNIIGHNGEEIVGTWANVVMDVTVPTSRETNLYKNGPDNIGIRLKTHGCSSIIYKSQTSGELHFSKPTPHPNYSFVGGGASVHNQNAILMGAGTNQLYGKSSRTTTNLFLHVAYAHKSVVAAREMYTAIII